MKDMSDLWIIVCVLCCFSLTECQAFYTIQNTTNWFTAFQTCKMLSGRLPGVNISNNQLKLQDLGVTKNISSPFWTGVTYDFLDIKVTEPHYGYEYPYTCCETIENVGGSHQFTCSNCSTYYRFICATSSTTISANGTTTEFFPWQNASQECKSRNQTLPSRDNAQFLDKLTAPEGAFWLDGIRQINFTPDNGIQTRNCLYSVIGIIHEGNCSNNSMTTVCIFDNKSPGSESLPTKTNDTGAVIGGVVGSVLVAIVITVVIVILVRKHRSRKDNNDQEKPVIMNSCFGVSRTSSLEKGNTKTTNQAETSNYFHTQSQKHTMKEQQSSNHGKAGENTYERVASVLYTVVQKDIKPNKAQHCGEEIKGSEDNDGKYDKTSYCSKINQAASSGNVYDKANFKHHDNSEYDTTHDINFKHNDNSEYNTTKDIHFKHNDNSKYDTTKDINISIDATYDHV